MGRLFIRSSGYTCMCWGCGMCKALGADQGLAQQLGTPPMKARQLV